MSPDAAERERFDRTMRALHFGAGARDHEAFAPRLSHLPPDAFRDPLEWCTRKRVRWTAIALLVIVLIVLAWTGHGAPANW